MKCDFKNDQRFSLTSSVVVTDIDGEAVLLDSRSGQYFGLNQVGTNILQLIKAGHNLKAIREALIRKYPENSEEVETDLHELLHDLLEQQLISSTV